jgi:hypothetical protein
MNRISPYFKQVRHYTRKFYYIPYDEQYESRDFTRSKIQTGKMTVPPHLSDDMKDTLIKLYPKSFVFLGYSKNIKYTCKTLKEIQFEKDHPLG